MNRRVESRQRTSKANLEEVLLEHYQVILDTGYDSWDDGWMSGVAWALGFRSKSEFESWIKGELK